MKLIFALVDAMKSKYLTESYMPFLYEFASKHYYVKRIIPSPGFCERSEVFSGLDSFNTGNFNAIGYDPNCSEYSKSNVLNFLCLIEEINYRTARYILRKYRNMSGIKMQPYFIPGRSLKFFSLTEDGKKKYIEHNTLFDVLKESGKTYTLSLFTSLGNITEEESDVFSKLQNEINKEVDFIPVYFGEIDSAGHKFGSDLEAIRPFLQRMDTTLKKLYDYAQINGYEFAVLGDHGMVPVEQYINVLEIINESQFKLHKDFELFVDSTTLRMWFSSKLVRKYYVELLSYKIGDKGVLADASNFEKYRIPLDVCSTNKPLYGDLLWCANPGILIYPDYFNWTVNKYNGMHGYLKIDTEDGVGLYIDSSSSLVKDEERLYEVCGHLCKLLNVTEPNVDWKREFVK